MAHQGSDTGMLELVRGIYDAALDAAHWSRFLARFGQEFASEIALIWANDFSDRSVQIHGGATSLAALHGIDAHYLSSFESHYCHCNVWMENEHLHHEGQIVNSSELFSDRQLPRTEWYADWLRPQGLFYSFAAVVEKRNRRSFNLTAVRSRGRGPYTAADAARLHTLMPHLQTAFALHRRLHRANALAHASMAVLDSLPMGVVLLGENACVLHANTRAHALAQESGLLRLGGHDTLHATVHADDLRLQRAMRMAVATGVGVPLSAGCGLRLRGLAGTELHVLVAPLPHWSKPFGAHAAGAVFVSDPTSALCSLEDVLCGLYRLTPAEARLAQALVGGLSPQEYAEQQALSIHTVRSQFKAAAAKVGVRRQADFVRAVLTGPAMLRWSQAEAQAAARSR